MATVFLAVYALAAAISVAGFSTHHTAIPQALVGTGDADENNFPPAPVSPEPESSEAEDQFQEDETFVSASVLKRIRTSESGLISIADNTLITGVSRPPFSPPEI